jgi:hypothetical protein
MVRTCKNGQNLQKWSELAKMVRTCQKMVNMAKNSVKFDETSVEIMGSETR